MSNSKLVTYVKLSPNHTDGRNHKIDWFIPHCVVGQVSVESLGDMFAKTSRGASSTYGIGFDGRMALYVDESNRPWTTSSSYADNRGITVECASDSTDPYAFKDVVYESLIKLAVDCCERNGKTKMIWFGDRTKTLNYTPASNEMVIAVHRWFANKSCPGDWLYNRLGSFADEVNKRLNGIRYRVHQQTYGWLPWVGNGDVAGYTGKSKRAESIIIDGIDVEYMVHQQTYGDSAWVSTGHQCGVTGESKRLEGFAVRLKNPNGKRIRYKAHLQGTGWTDWVYDGAYAGTKGESRRMEAIIIEVI